jgi:hypothetical protein
MSINDAPVAKAEHATTTDRNPAREDAVKLLDDKSVGGLVLKTPIAPDRYDPNRCDAMSGMWTMQSAAAGNDWAIRRFSLCTSAQSLAVPSSGLKIDSKSKNTSLDFPREPLAW